MSLLEVRLSKKLEIQISPLYGLASSTLVENRRSVLRLIVGEGIRLGLIGITIGTSAALMHPTELFSLVIRRQNDRSRYAY
jgi:hypothetical protein